MILQTVRQFLIVKHLRYDLFRKKEYLHLVIVPVRLGPAPQVPVHRPRVKYKMLNLMWLPLILKRMVRIPAN